MDSDYKNILIAIDASDEADDVLRAAIALAPDKLSAFRVITVIPPVLAGIAGIDGASFAATWPMIDFENQIAREVAAKVGERAAKYGIQPEQTEMKLGRPAAEIRAYAEAVGADLVVIGSHARRGVTGMLGSTANGVLHGTPCDVLVVRVK